MIRFTPDHDIRSPGQPSYRFDCDSILVRSRFAISRLVRIVSSTLRDNAADSVWLPSSSVAIIDICSTILDSPSLTWRRAISNHVSRRSFTCLTSFRQPTILRPECVGIRGTPNTKWLRCRRCDEAQRCQRVRLGDRRFLTLLGACVRRTRRTVSNQSHNSRCPARFSRP
jgi:hypothetical protein